jgi:predicted TPR repeat methyltransferase
VGAWKATSTWPREDDQARSPMSRLERSWGAFSDERAAGYLTEYGHPSLESRDVVAVLLRRLASSGAKTLLDLGCGNGGMASFLRDHRVDLAYTGVDFSEPLLRAARASNPGAVFLRDDVETLNSIQHGFDVVLYSHVLEMLGSPQAALQRAAQLTSIVLVRFFEPPEADVDSVELLEMDVGASVVPYLRRTMSRDYYRLVLARAGCRSVDVYRCESSRDQVHVLDFAKGDR